MPSLTASEQAAIDLAERLRADSPRADPALAPKTSRFLPTPPPMVRRSPPTRRKIVLYAGGASGGTINTGVWPGWGGKEQDKAELMWAAAGVHVSKLCPGLDCVFEHQKGSSVPISGPDAPDAIVVETVNAPKFGVAASFHWPWSGSESRELVSPGVKRPVLGMFYLEPEGAYPGHTLLSSDMREKFDFSVAAPSESTIPVSLMCPWGQESPSPAVASVFGPLAAPYFSAVSAGDKEQGRGIAMFSDRGVHPTAARALREFMSAAQGDGMEHLIHAYTGPVKNTNGFPAGFERSLEHLPTRLQLIRSYKFVLVAQSSLDWDWVEPELSHALVAGAVPIVWGPANLWQWLPTEGAAVDASATKDGAAVWAQVKQMLSGEQEGEREYWKRLSWRRSGREIAEEVEAPGPQGGDSGVAMESERALVAEHLGGFAERVDRCAHYAECRICALVNDKLDGRL